LPKWLGDFSPFNQRLTLTPIKIRILDLVQEYWRPITLFESLPMLEHRFFLMMQLKIEALGVRNLGLNKNKFHKTCSTIMNQ